MFLQRGHQVFQIVTLKSQMQNFGTWERGNGFQNSYFYLLPASMSPVERRVKLGISWARVNNQCRSPNKKEMLPYYTGKLFFLTVSEAVLIITPV